MAVFETLTLAERARQLGNPEGAVGLAVADWLNENNRQANAKNVALLGGDAGNRVLEIGFGNGRTVPDVIAQALDVTYCGIDISPTMVTEASTFKAALVASGKASFDLASAENMPCAEDSFDSVFSIGVIHFWTEVMRPGGSMPMACLAPREAPDFARPEHGFHLRDAASWDALCRAAGFTDVHVETVESEQITPSGAPIRRYGIIVRGRA
ncbi:SAM-dependent methyltransferase [Mesorhizobium robiniae]|uniref:SAM-dependent methyltransferase n=1 Tax=Mesorhizobium robiniae TaxID=559315 RepID=A0ABV2H075_9HYPH|nr:class I SAM-dependent methyltransferase [Mesorhizobium sp. ZC-5]MCV3244025.1 class I SAM-dependent methyltransferase [Mesorhizobium sp. ZC-5]